MADQFPSWWSASANSAPECFQRAEDVPNGYVARAGKYNHEIGQFESVEEAEDREAAKRKTHLAAQKAEAAVSAEKAAEPAKPAKAKVSDKPGEQPFEHDPITGQALDAGASAVARADRVEGRVRTESLLDNPPFDHDGGGFPALAGKKKAELQDIARAEGVAFNDDASNRELREAIEAKRAS